MAKQKMSKTERASWEKDLATLRAAVAQCERALAEDDECAKAADAQSHSAAVKAIAAGGTGDTRQQIARGILAIREGGGSSAAETVYGRDRK